MAKPATSDGYSDQYIRDCERVLVTLLRGLGPWNESVYLVDGLTPRYLVKARPPAVPAHAGTMDVDIVIDLHILVSLTCLKAFAFDQRFERKDGSVAVAKSRLGESDEPEQREARALRQREVSSVIEQLLARVW